MPTPVLNWAALPTANTASPNLAQNLGAGMQLWNMPKKQKEELRQLELANALAEIQNQYAPQMTEAELAYRQQMAPHMQAQTGLIGEQAKYYGQDIQSQMGLRGAQAGLANQESKFMPLRYLIEGSRAQNVSSRFGAAYEMSRALQQMPAPTRAQWIADNGDAYNDMMATLSNKTLQEQSGSQNSILSEALADYFPKYGKGQGQGQGNAPQQSLIPPNAFKLPTPEQNANLKNISELAANKGLTTAATERQLEGAIQVSGIMNNPEFQNKAIAASEYAGALGKGKSAVDALSQKNPQAYENYISFVNHDMVLLENRIKTLDQMGATDSQREQLQNLYKKTMDSITSNPKQFITQFNMLGESLDRVAQSVGVSASPASNAPLKRLQKYNPIPEPGQQSAPGTKVINGQQFQNINGKWYQK